MYDIVEQGPRFTAVYIKAEAGIGSSCASAEAYDRL